MSATWAIVFFVITLTFLIFIHELGHFVTAKRSGVKVLEFGIGIPPRIWGIQRGETLYSINWIPLGGFCKMLGEEDPSKEGSLASKRPRSRLLILSAGSLVMLIFPVFLFSLVYMVPLNKSIPMEGIEVTAIISGMPADIAGMQIGDEIVQVNATDITTLDEFEDLIEDNAGVLTTLTVQRADQEIELQLIPRADDSDAQDMLGITTEAYARVTIEIVRVEKDTPAEASGMQEGDRIERINGIPVTSLDTLKELTDENKGKVTIYTVLRDDEPVELQMIPREEYPSDQGPLGVGIEAYYEEIYKERKAYAPWTAVRLGLEKNRDMYVALKDGIEALVSKDIPFEAGGVVAAGQVTTEIAKRGTWEDLMWWAGILSANLGIVNLLPLPALDGGRIVFVLIEIARRGKRISPEKEGMVHLAGFFMLITFILFVTYQDIDRVISGDSLLR